MRPTMNRVAWGLTVVLAAVVLVGGGLLGVRLRPYWVAKYRGAGADLRGVLLIRAPLHKADLSDANLERAKLTGADLSEARLDSANLSHASLAFTNLHGAVLDYARLADSDLSGAVGGHNILEYAGLRRALLRGARLTQSICIGADLREADLRGADLRCALLQGADLRAARLEGANLLGATGDKSTRWPTGYDPAQHGTYGLKPGADLRGTDLSDLRLTSRHLRGANLAHANLRDTLLYGADLRDSDLSGADLSTAHWEALKSGSGSWYERVSWRPFKLTGARYDTHTRWPAGFDPAKAGAVRVR